MLVVYCTNEECSEYKIAKEVLAHPREGEDVWCGVCQTMTTAPEDLAVEKGQKI